MLKVFSFILKHQLIKNYNTYIPYPHQVQHSARTILRLIGSAGGKKYFEITQNEYLTR